MMAVLVAVVLFIAVIAGGLLLINHKSTNSARGPGSAANTTTTGGAAAASASTTPTTGASGATAIPAASATPPSLADAYTPDPVLVLKTLSAYIDWVYAHPNPVFLANYMLRSSRTYSTVLSQLTEMQKNGWHELPSETNIVWAKANAPFQPEAATVNGHPAYLGTNVRAVIDVTPQANELLNSAGQVVNEHLSTPPQQLLVVDLAQGPDGQFRISDISALNPPDGIRAFES